MLGEVLAAIEARIARVERGLNELPLPEDDLLRLRQAILSSDEAAYEPEEADLPPPPDKPTPPLGVVCVVVTELETGLPIEGATVGLRTQANVLLDSGTTDEDGRWCSGPRNPTATPKYRVGVLAPCSGGTASGPAVTAYYSWPSGEREHAYGVCCFDFAWVVTDTLGRPVEGLAPSFAGQMASNGACANSGWPECVAAESAPGVYSGCSRAVVPLPAACSAPFTVNSWSVPGKYDLANPTMEGSVLPYCAFGGAEPFVVHCGQENVREVVMSHLWPDWLPFQDPQVCGWIECGDQQAAGQAANPGYEGRAIRPTLVVTFTDEAPGDIFGSLVGTSVELDYVGVDPASPGGYLYDSECLNVPNMAFDCYFLSDPYPTGSGRNQSCRFRFRTATRALTMWSWTGSNCQRVDICPDPDGQVPRRTRAVYRNALPCYYHSDNIFTGVHPWPVGSNLTAQQVTLSWVSSAGGQLCHPTDLPIGPSRPGCSPRPVHAEVTE